MEIGPRLPPHLISKNVNDNKDECVEEDTIKTCNDSDSGKNVDDKVNEMNEDESGSTYGPALPPGFKQRTIIGPCRPEVFTEENVNTDRKTICDCEDDQESEDDAFGPQLPTKKEEDEYYMKRNAEIESRARVKKDDNKECKNKKVEREEWMTELPPEIAKNFGLGPRTFRSKDVNLGDRSVWTDIPSEREMKKDKSQPKDEKRHEKSKKEIDMEKYVSEHNERYRSESLLDIHEKDQKKKKRKDGSSTSERRPFDRETDLGVRQMDAAKRKSLIKQSTHLNSKFEHSKQGPTYL